MILCSIELFIDIKIEFCFVQLSILKAKTVIVPSVSRSYENIGSAQLFTVTEVIPISYRPHQPPGEFTASRQRTFSNFEVLQVTTIM